VVCFRRNIVELADHLMVYFVDEIGKHFYLRERQMNGKFVLLVFHAVT